MLSLDKIYHAAYVLKGVARKTDLIAAPQLVPGLDELYLKTENLQVTGSFKLRAPTTRSRSCRRRRSTRASSPALPETMPRAWPWLPPTWASRASSACLTARRS